MMNPIRVFVTYLWYAPLGAPYYIHFGEVEMSRRNLTGLATVALAALVGVACADSNPTEPALSAEATQATFNHGPPAHANAPMAKNFVSPMDPEQEVHEVDSNATGNAVYHLSKDGTALHFKLIVANIEDVTQAHIHRAPVGENGPVVAFLANFAPLDAEEGEGLTANGVIAEGTITAADLVGPLADMSLNALLMEMRKGNTYTNVHTVEFPMGEVRGQIMPAGPGAGQVRRALKR